MARVEELRSRALRRLYEAARLFDGGHVGTDNLFKWAQKGRIDLIRRFLMSS